MNDSICVLGTSKGSDYIKDLRARRDLNLACIRVLLTWYLSFFDS